MRTVVGALLLALVIFASVSVLAHSQSSTASLNLNEITVSGPVATVTGTVTPSAGATVSTVSVDWGDGSTPSQGSSATIQFTHTYTATGAYSVVVAATDSAGTSDSSQSYIDVVSTTAPTAPGQPASGVSCLANNGNITSVGTCIEDAIPLSFLGLMLSLALVAVSYMAGEIINLSGLKGWYKKELWETAKSALLIAVILSSLVIASGIATTVAGNPAAYQSGSSATAGSSIVSNLDSLYSSALTQYITPQLNSAFGAFGANLGMSMGVATLGSINIHSWAPVPILVGAVEFGSEAQLYTSSYIQPASPSGFSFMKNVMSLVVIPVMLIFQVQKDLFPLIVSMGFAVFLPLGIILRAFPFLRPIGGTMIAIAIGASLVYPALLIGFNLPISNYFTLATGYGQQSTSCSASLSAAGIFCIFFTGVSDTITVLECTTPATSGCAILAATIGPGNIGGALDPKSPISQYNAGFAIGFTQSLNSIYPDLNFVITTTISQILQFILFVFDIIIGLVIVNSISSSLGGIDFNKRRGIGKFKLF